MLHKVRSYKVMGKTGILNQLRLIILAASISALLSGCLVEKKSVDKIFRTTDTLHIYKTGEFIEYDVIAVTQTTGNPTQYGTLRVEWNSVGTLNNPIDGSIISPDLKETTTLTYDSNNSGEPDAVSARYISQVNTVPADPNQGSIILHAIDDEVDADYWPYDPTNTGNSGGPVISPIIFESPLTIGDSSSLAYSIMECDASLLCNNEIYTFTDDVSTVGDTREVETPLGIFSNPFQISFSGGTSPVGQQALSFLGDIRDACGTSADLVTHNGNLFVMPEIGIIRIENIPCYNAPDTTIYYTITARATNISF